MFQSLNHPHSPSLDSLTYAAKPSTRHSPLGVFHQEWVERKAHLLQPAGNSLPNALQGVVGHHYWLMFNLLLQSCFPSGQPPGCTGAWGYSSPGEELGISLCLTSWGFCCPISPACQGHFEALVYYFIFSEWVFYKKKLPHNSFFHKHLSCLSPHFPFL